MPQILFCVKKVIHLSEKKVNLARTISATANGAQWTVLKNGGAIVKVDLKRIERELGDIINK